MNAFLYLICHWENKTRRTHWKQTTKCLTSLEISEIRVSLSSYCSFKMPSNRASASTDLVKNKQQNTLINWFVSENSTFVKVRQRIDLVCMSSSGSNSFGGKFTNAIRLTAALANCELNQLSEMSHAQIPAADCITVACCPRCYKQRDSEEWRSIYLLIHGLTSSLLSRSFIFSYKSTLTFLTF